MINDGLGPEFSRNTGKEFYGKFRYDFKNGEKKLDDEGITG